MKQLFDGKLLICRLPFFGIPKKYGNLASMSRLKVAPNMADPTSMKHSVSNLNPPEDIKVFSKLPLDSNFAFASYA